MINIVDLPARLYLGIGADTEHSVIDPNTNLNDILAPYEGKT